jgi:hypothetical protein
MLVSQRVRIHAIAVLQHGLDISALRIVRETTCRYPHETVFLGEDTARRQLPQFTSAQASATAAICPPTLDLLAFRTLRPYWRSLLTLRRVGASVCT